MESLQEQGLAPDDLALETVRAWTRWLTEVERWLMPHVARREARRHAWASLRGLRSPVERKHGGQGAEVHGDATPEGRQHGLGRARGDAAAVREALRASLGGDMGAPHAGLVRVETGLLKQGPPSAGVARQSSGPAGRVAPCQSGGGLASARLQGPALLAGALDGPHAWTNDRERGERAGCPRHTLWPRSPREHARGGRGLATRGCQRPR